MQRHILVYTPSGRDAVLTERLFASARLPVSVCASEKMLTTRLGLDAGALLLTEEGISGTTAAMLRQFVEQQPPWSDLPVLLLTKHGADSLQAQRAVEHLGNVTLLERPVRTLALISAARTALRARERQHQLRALSQRKDEFLATLAHELRNPLAPIQNATRLFERLHPSPRTTTLVGMVDRQLTHLTRLVDDLMDVARIASGKLQLQPTLTSVDAVITQALEMTSGIFLERQHRLQIHRPLIDHPLRADHVRVVQSLANVLVNAAKFTPLQGDVSLRVEVTPPDVVIRVQDSGRGLKHDEIATIFEMFAQSRSVGEPSNGLGIGLHLARVCAQMHGGSIAASSAGPGQGSEFVITLPIVETSLPATDPKPATASGSLELPRTVLLVDDNEDAARSLEALLSLEGIDVTVAHDGTTAVALAQAQRPDAIVMDIGMPRMNGYEAARLIRQVPPGKRPFMIALTGWGQETDRTLAREAGFDCHLVKPVDLQELLRCLATRDVSDR